MVPLSQLTSVVTYRHSGGVLQPCTQDQYGLATLQSEVIHALRLTHTPLTFPKVRNMKGGERRMREGYCTRTPRAVSTTSTTQRSLTITSWNCRGLSAGASYLEHIVRGGSDVVVLSEHWYGLMSYINLTSSIPNTEAWGNQTLD